MGMIPEGAWLSKWMSFPQESGPGPYGDDITIKKNKRFKRTEDRFLVGPSKPGVPNVGHIPPTEGAT